MSRLVSTFMSMVDRVLESICHICKHSGDFHFKCMAGKILEKDKKSCPNFHLTNEQVWYKPQLTGCGGDRGKSNWLAHLSEHDGPSKPSSC